MKRYRAFSILIASVLALFGGYLMLLCHPAILFSYHFVEAPFEVYSDEPIPSGIEPVLKEVQARISRSPLYRTDKIRKIYFCNKHWRFALFANYRYSVGGLTYSEITDNIFLRESHIDANRLIGPSGKAVDGERTLAYFITHEIAHDMTADEIGAIAFLRLPAWKNEGYADYVGKGDDFDYNAALAMRKQGDRRMDPATSGLYLRYHLWVYYLLKIRNLTPQQLLRQDLEPARVEAEILR